MTPPPTALIGHGYWGRNLARNLNALGALAAIVESDATSRKAAGEAYPKAPCHESVDAVLADPSIKAVMIATPAATHGALVARALEAGKHVFVEKPLCLDVTEAERLAADAARRGLTLMVGHLLLYHPAFVALKACVAEGRLGRLRYVYSTRLSLGKIRREENALWSFAPHDISMILQLMGGLPERVIAAGGQYLHAGVADTTLSHLAFPGDVQAHIFVSWIHPYKDQRLVVVGDKAMAVFNDVSPGPEKLLIYQHEARWDGTVPVVSKAEAEPIPYETVEPLRREVETFLAAAVGGPRPPSDAREGIAVLRVLDACQRALVSGNPVEMAHG
ncbi:MAG: Gfo/Idh/MocA family protein [Candidatus Eiseniibacteriota bacterium]